MSANDPADMPFIDYVNAVEDELESIYSITLGDAGIELEQLAHAQEAGESPSEWVDWFAEKWDLIPRSRWSAW